MAVVLFVLIYSDSLAKQGGLTRELVSPKVFSYLLVVHSITIQFQVSLINGME